MTTEETAEATNIMPIIPAIRVSVAYIIVIVLSFAGVVRTTVVARRRAVAASWGTGFGTGANQPFRKLDAR